MPQETRLAIFRGVAKDEIRCKWDSSSDTPGLDIDVDDLDASSTTVGQLFARISGA